MRFITLVLGSAAALTAFSIMSTHAATPERLLPYHILQ
ncbi:hypothetical protein TL5118_03086 [Thalassovita autumnalis]|jgi:hypothetical protein|uniref:Uncharacterized protein n=1 Tax=Thalassovita autumnalis TaxID=2072972 RepID=A0A0P1FLU9_9RHOB|nr:hypothetical protein TL5118_03086 [Thalassovita autumnalis]CUH73670.1 hypothetical protein TL5120_03482 [Thalassovita autumnalis]